jgi:hypothetical protein
MEFAQLEIVASGFWALSSFKEQILEPSALKRLRDLFVDFSFIQEQGFSTLYFAVLQRRSEY